MKRPALLFFSILILGACSQEKHPRQNPLVAADATTLGSWTADWGREIGNAELLDPCADYWVDTPNEEMSGGLIEQCQDVSEILATALTEAGYGDVRPVDIRLPPIWVAYLKRRAPYRFGVARRTPEEQAERDRALEGLGLKQD